MWFNVTHEARSLPRPFLCDCYPLVIAGPTWIVVLLPQIATSRASFLQLVVILPLHTDSPSLSAHGQSNVGSTSNGTLGRSRSSLQLEFSRFDVHEESNEAEAITVAPLRSNSQRLRSSLKSRRRPQYPAIFSIESHAATVKGCNPSPALCGDRSG